MDSPHVPVPEAKQTSRAFVGRAQRHDVSFPLVFVSETGECMPGTCDNLSESGLLATFSAPMDIWTEGRIDLSFGAGLLGLHVRVARVLGLSAGFAFQNMDDGGRQKLRELMSTVSETGLLPNHL